MLILLESLSVKLSLIILELFLESRIWINDRSTLAAEELRLSKRHLHLVHEICDNTSRGS